MITAIQNPNRINLTPVSRNIFGGDVVYGELSGSFRKMLRNARIQKQLRRPASIPASQLPKNITANKRKIFGITPSNIEIFAVPKNPEIPNKRPNYENLLSGDEILLLNGDDAIIELNETGQLGSWLSKTVRKVKKEISRTTKRVGKEIKRSSKKVSKQIKRSGKDINKGVKKLGKNVEVLVKKNKKTLLHIAGAVALVLTYGAISSALAAKGAAAAAASSSAGAAGAAGAGAAAGTAGTMAIPVTL
nr:hypothetical protein [bacterium]